MKKLLLALTIFLTSGICFGDVMYSKPSTNHRDMYCPICGDNTKINTGRECKHFITWDYVGRYQHTADEQKDKEIADLKKQIEELKKNSIVNNLPYIPTDPIITEFSK